MLEALFMVGWLAAALLLILAVANSKSPAPHICPVKGCNFSTKDTMDGKIKWESTMRDHIQYRHKGKLKQ